MGSRSSRGRQHFFVIPVHTGIQDSRSHGPPIKSGVTTSKNAPRSFRDDQIALAIQRKAPSASIRPLMTSRPQMICRKRAAGTRCATR